ncbi:MAG TPA: tetratricopeptide repeat protein [Pyrinomonadaceae bacterium]|nr:tetratricopeptide repeat protein [Pyrinomonadaceae bacterium]
MRTLFALLRTLSLCLLVAVPAALARQTPAAGAAWQVLRYELTVTPSAGDERAIKVRAAISARNVGSGAGNTFTVRLAPEAKVEGASAGGGAARLDRGTEARTRLQTARVTLPARVEVGGETNVVFDYTLPVTDNSGLASVSPEGTQFLPLSFWYPTPNSPVSQRGADYAPFRLTVAAPAGETAVSAGRAAGAGQFELALHGQPFFLTGRWEAVEGSGEARNVSALVPPGATAEERKAAASLVELAAAARAFYAGLLGPAPDAPVRLVSVNRGAGFDMGGTILLDGAVFRRPKIDSVTALRVADAVARLWVGGAAPVQGEGAGAVREGLARHLSTLFVEKQFGRDEAEAERLRMALAYATVARRDAPLGQLNPAYETYFNSVVNKGALVWRLLMDAAGREQFLSAVRGVLAPAGGRAVTLAALRGRVAEAGGERVARLMPPLFDLPTDTDLLVGLPQQRPGGWLSNLRNAGSFEVEVPVRATTEAGEQLTVTVRIPAKDFGEAFFKTAGRIARVEVDPDKLYPQLDYANDLVPQGPNPDESTEQARILVAQQPARAETLAREVLARAPGKEEARVVLARALLEQNKLDDAEREFRAALDRPLPTPSTLAWTHIGLGEVLVRRGRPAEAARLFDAAVKIDAEYASTLAARAARLRAEAAAGSTPAPDEQIRTAAQQLDAAILTGKKVGVEAQLVAGELSRFAAGVVGTQPDVWQTRVLRTEPLGANRIAADVSLNIRSLGQTRASTAVFVFARTPAGWRLADIQFLEEVR